MTVMIPLNNGMHAIVDDDDAAAANKRKWRARIESDRKIYAFTEIRIAGKRKRVSMHRFLLNPPDDKQVDHINGDPLCNTRSNLRLASHAENMRNRKMHKQNACGVKGVFKCGSRFRAQIMVNRNKISLGTYLTADEAHAAYISASERYHGEFGRAA